MKKKILWISYCVPYDSVGHAGGKTHNFHLKKAQSSGLFDIHLISLGYANEMPKLDLDAYGVQNTIGVIQEDFFHKILYSLINLNADLNPFAPYCGFFRHYSFFKEAIKNYQLKNKCPDIIILQWTQVLLLMPLVKELFPKSKIIAIEEDVAFLGLNRRYKYEKNMYLKHLYKMRYKKLKNLELEALKLCDLIFVNNYKDKKLLLDNGCPQEKLQIIPIYYDSYTSLKHNFESNTIVFFGAMRRKENHLSALWFIDHVLPQLPDDITFTIVGSNPRKSLMKLQNAKIRVTGFVDDVSPYMENCLCLVAPLVLGAGIKIKILEAFSAGVPVLTNTIGIEGIPAQNGKNYFHCETPEEYIKTVKQIIHERSILPIISYNAKMLMQEKFNSEEMMEETINLINKV